MHRKIRGIHLFDSISDACVPYDQFKDSENYYCTSLSLVGVLKVLFNVLVKNKLVNTHHRKSFFIVQLLFIRFFKRKIFHTVHAPFSHYGGFYRRLICTYSYKNLIFNSYQTRDSFAKFNKSYNDSPVIFNGVDIETLISIKKFNNKIKKNKERNSNFFSILLCGRSVPAKNLEFVVEAIKENSLDQPIELIIVSDYPPSNQPTVIHNKNLLISKHPFMKQKKLWELACKVDAVVSPSIIEGYGNWQIEASFLCDDILLSDIPIHRDYFESHLFFDPLNQSDFISSLSSLIKGENKKKTCLKDPSSHNRNKVIKMYEEAYGI
ncbi:glycosyltransferase [Gammaproteobacteria bacterium]|nr:glycosyltransferase [Gammaproteobacteria bacterium]